MTSNDPALATVPSSRNLVRVVDRAPVTTGTPEAPPIGYDSPNGIADADAVFEASGLDVHYGNHKALGGVNMRIARNQITALIGPSGCGKSTYLRCFNRMNDLIEGCKVDGELTYHGIDLYGADVSAVEVRRRVGMVFQKPVPFPRSVYDNVAYGLKIAGLRKGIDDRVEQALRRAALWDEVKDRLKKSALGLSGGQQQRLCIARAIAIEPEVLLMDEPCSALDPIATARIEDLMRELRETFTIVIVTHNMQQAARCSDRTAFFTTSVNSTSDLRTGTLVEYDHTEKIFSNPDDERTEQYVTGRFG